MAGTDTSRPPMKNSGRLDFDFGAIDWKQYEDSRPPYPPALYDKIFKYHADHNDRWNLALDVGAGGGVATAQLLKKFQKVVFSDAGEGYVQQAKERFASEAKDGRISFVARKFDNHDPASDFPDGQLVDLITAATCIHFGEPDEVAQQLGALLRPGGTLAVFTYGVRPNFPPGEETVQAAFDAVLTGALHVFEEKLVPVASATATKVYGSQYDNIKFDTQTWQHVLRSKSHPKWDLWPGFEVHWTSRVQPETETLESLDANLITKTVVFEQLAGLVRSYYPGIDLISPLVPQLTELKKVMRDRALTVQFPAVVTLATKR